MNNFIPNLLRMYRDIRDLASDLKITSRFLSPRGTFRFDDLSDLGVALSEGKLDIGDRVTGSGWLSTYSYWYLPKAYSPYRFSTEYMAIEEKMAMRMWAAPALLPSGQIPTNNQNSRLCFLYPLHTNGFTLELAGTQVDSQSSRIVDYQSVDDQPWFFNLDTGSGNFSSNPEQWIYSMGDEGLQDKFPNLEDKNSKILTDPSRVREIVKVPDHCKPIPVVLPKNFGFLNKNVQLTGRVSELDKSVLNELCQLGAPLTEKVYNNFYNPYISIPPFCIEINEGTNDSLSTVKKQSNDLNPHKIVTCVVEFFFETSSDGSLVEIGDNEIIEWFIPSVKDFIFSHGRYVFSDRWVGKIYGFDGPIYIYKTGPMEVSISPTGVFSAYCIADLNNGFAETWANFRIFVLSLLQKMVIDYKNKFNKKIEHRITYLTDYSWQLSFGQVLEGSAVDQICQTDLRFQQLRQEIQNIGKKVKPKELTWIIDKFTKPISKDVERVLTRLDIIRHNKGLLPLTKKIFDLLGLPNWQFHDMKDFGTDHFVYASTDPKITVSIQIKSHIEILKDDFYEEVLSQRVRSDAYSANLYLIFLYGNSKSTKLTSKKRKEGEIIVERFSELKRNIERTNFRADTEVISPENLAHVIQELSIDVEDFIVEKEKDQ